VIVTHIWQKLSSIERKKVLIVTNFWQLFSQIFGETFSGSHKIRTVIQVQRMAMEWPLSP